MNSTSESLERTRQDARDDASRNRINIFVPFMPEAHRKAYEEARAEYMKVKAVNSARDHFAYGWASCPPYGLDAEFHSLYYEEFQRLRLTVAR